MSLRQQLRERSKVAGCVYQQTQMRNLPEISATDTATTLQLLADNSHEIGALSATSTATTPQPTSCARDLYHPSKVTLITPNCAPVATVAVPPNDLWHRLEAIANKCCDHWQVSAERRAEMLASLRAMTPDWQRHWIEHLEASYGKPK